MKTVTGEHLENWRLAICLRTNWIEKLIPKDHMEIPTSRLQKWKIHFVPSKHDLGMRPDLSSEKRTGFMLIYLVCFLGIGDVANVATMDEGIGSWHCAQESYWRR